MSPEEKLSTLCAEILCVDASGLTMETKRSDIPDLDSLAIIQIIAEMQEVFHKPIADEVIESTPIVTLGDFLKLLK